MRMQHHALTEHDMRRISEFPAQYSAKEVGAGRERVLAGRWPVFANVRFTGAAGCHLHPAQEDDEQPPQLEPPPELPGDASPEDLPMPKRDMRFAVSFAPHCGQRTSGLEPKTSFSKQQEHLLH